MSYSTSVTASFGGDTGPLQAAAGRAEKIIGGLGGAISSLTANFTALASVGSFVALGKGAIDLAGKLADVSQNLDIDVESLQALQALTQRNGVAAEQLAAALGKVKNNVFDAAAGNKSAAEALGKLGLNAATLVKLPLDKQLAAIATGAAHSKNQTEAFNAVSAIFGERVGPRLVASLRELAEQGLPAVTAQAREAGHVMSKETVAALDRAGDAIDDWKLRAKVSLGNIVVSFRTEEGLALLWAQLERVVVSFGLGILDAIVEANNMIRAVISGAFEFVVNRFRDLWLDSILAAAARLNAMLPEFLQIDLKSIANLKSAGDSIGTSIAKAIASTSPSTFKADYQKVQDRHVAALKAAADAAAAGLESGIGHGAAAVATAGEAAATAIVTKAAPAIVAAGESAADAIRAAAEALARRQEADQAVARGAAAGLTTDEQAQLRAWIESGKKGTAPVFSRAGGLFTTSSAFATASPGALAELIRQLGAELQGLRPGTAFDVGDNFRIAELTARRAAAQRELETRRTVEQNIEAYGLEGARRYFTGDPLAFDALARQIQEGHTRTDESNKLLRDIKHTLGEAFKYGA